MQAVRDGGVTIASDTLLRSRAASGDPSNVLTAAAIEVFSVPRTLARGIAALEARFRGSAPGGHLAAVLDAVEGGMLERAARSLDAPDGMFGSPLLPLVRTLEGDVADVVFLGAPREDRGTPVDMIRRYSRAIFAYVESDTIPDGRFDPARGAWRLEGVRLADAGDTSLDELRAQVKALVLAGRLPVILGGGRSATALAMAAATEVRPDVELLHVDARSGAVTEAFARRGAPCFLSLDASGLCRPSEPCSRSARAALASLVEEVDLQGMDVVELRGGSEAETCREVAALIFEVLSSVPLERWGRSR